MEKIRGILWLALLFTLINGLLQKERGINDWSVNNIGDLKHVHFYNEQGKLQGIFVATEEGVLALINPSNGKLIWRKTLLKDKTINKIVVRNECKSINKYQNSCSNYNKSSLIS